MGGKKAGISFPCDPCGADKQVSDKSNPPEMTVFVIFPGWPEGFAVPEESCKQKNPQPLPRDNQLLE